MKAGMPQYSAKALLRYYKEGGRAVHHHNGPRARKRGRLGKIKAR